MPFVPDQTPSRFVPDKPAAAAPAPADDTVESHFTAPAQLLMHLISKGAAGLAGGMSAAGTGIAQAGDRILGLPAGSPDDAAANAAKVQNDLTYQPTSPTAKKMVDTIGAPGRYLAASTDSAADSAAQVPGIGPVLGAAVKSAAPIAATVLGGKVPGLEGEAPTEIPSTVGPSSTALPPSIAAARSLGYKMRPSDVAARNPAVDAAGNIPGRTREMFNDSTALAKEFDAHNQAVTTKAAGADVGIPNATKLMPADLEKTRQPHYQTYTDTGESLGSFKAKPELVSDLKGLASATDPQHALAPKVASRVEQLISMAETGELRGPQVIKDISWLRANKGRDVANALEDEIERQATGPTLAKFQSARTQIAKSHDIQDATTGGQVDAQDIKRLHERYPGMLTGNLKLIAEAAAELPNVTRLPVGGTKNSSIESLTIPGMVKAGVGAIARKIPGVNVGGRFQDRFGKVATPAEQANFVNYGKSPETPWAPKLDLAPPPGNAGIPPQQLGMTLNPGRPLGPSLDLEPPPGNAGIPPQQLGMALDPGPGVPIVKRTGKEVVPAGRRPVTVDQQGRIVQSQEELRGFLRRALHKPGNDK